MKFSHLISLFTLGMSLTGAHALADGLSTFVGKTQGNFINAEGSAMMNITGEDSAYFTWGEETILKQGLNSLTYISSDFITAPGETFNVGKLDYYNGDTRKGTNAERVSLDVQLMFEDGSRANFTVKLNLVSTPNNGSHHDNADIIQISTPEDENIIRIAGKPYALRVTFGETTQKGFSHVDRFHVFEGFSAQANLRAELVAPSPSALKKFEEAKQAARAVTRPQSQPQENLYELTPSRQGSDTIRPRSEPASSPTASGETSTQRPSDPARDPARGVALPSRFDRYLNNPENGSTRTQQTSRQTGTNQHSAGAGVSSYNTSRTMNRDLPASTRSEQTTSQTQQTRQETTSSSRLSFGTQAPDLQVQGESSTNSSRLYDTENAGSVKRSTPPIRESSSQNAVKNSPGRLAYSPTTSAPSDERAPGASQRPSSTATGSTSNRALAIDESTTPRPIHRSDIPDSQTERPEPTAAPSASSSQFTSSQYSPQSSSPSPTRNMGKLIAADSPRLYVIEEGQPRSVSLSDTDSAEDGDATYLSGGKYSIRRAVNISFFAQKGYHYQVQVSIDDEQWMDFGPSITGVGEQTSFYHPVGDTQVKRYRVQVKKN